MSRDLDLWAYQCGVTLDFSRPGKPTDNAFIESLNGKFRAECLNACWFMAKSRPLVANLHAWFEAQVATLPGRGPTAGAIRYALNHWDGLERFLSDGRIELDNNSVERAIRPVKLSRKNALSAGSDEGAANWAHIASLVETCKLNGVNQQAYFAGG